MSREYTVRDVLEAGDIEAVRAHHAKHKRRGRGQRWRVRYAIFILSTCYGLRASELASLPIKDIHADAGRPWMFVVGKGRKSRSVPLSWCAWALADLREYLEWRRAAGAGPDDPAIISVERRSFGKRLARQQVWAYYRQACRPILSSGKRITTHTGRHTFATHALAAGFPPQSVRSALGHTSLATTTLYAHILDDPACDGQLYNTKV